MTLLKNRRIFAGIFALAVSTSMLPLPLGGDAVAQNNFNPKTLVWYASYGSNLNRERFMCYLKGCTPPGATSPNPGCRDSSDPLADKPHVLQQYELYFADEERSIAKWGGASAFIRHAANSKVFGRMYLITYEQFNDVVLQENGVERREKLANTLPSPESIDKKTGLKLHIPDSLYDQPKTANPLYDHLVYIGSEDGHSIFSFTTSNRDLPIGTPTLAYLGRIVPGLREAYPAMSEDGIYSYLSQAKGIRSKIPPDQLRDWVSQLLRKK